LIRIHFAASIRDKISPEIDNVTGNKGNVRQLDLQAYKHAHRV